MKRSGEGSTRGVAPVRRRRKGHAAWAQGVECRTLARTAGDAVEAACAFRALPIREQLALVREVVLTRRVELCRAYPNVIAVSDGFRRRRRGRSGLHGIEREPCVKFLVRKKWDRATGEAGGSIPKHIFAHWTVAKGRRVVRARRLYAVGTDVEGSSERAKTRPHAPQTVVAGIGGAATTGVITCAITRSTPPGGVYALGCEHVFTPSPSPGGGFQKERVLLDSTKRLIATTVNVAGVLSDSAAHSLDSQLATVAVADRAALREALGGLDIEGYATSEDEVKMAANLWILTPRGPIKATLNRMVGEEHAIDYGDSKVEDIRFECLIEVQTDSPTREGDSGAPLCTRQKGGLLIGMHIAGPPDSVADDASDTLSYVLPAWHVLDASRYPEATQGEQWVILTKM